MPDIPVGARGDSKVSVTTDNAISFLDHNEARVLATPWLIAYLELTSRNLVKPFLLDGQDTVGTQVNVRHLAATPIGMEATFSSEVIAAEERRITFRVEAWDERDKIAEGTHERAVIDVARFAARVQSKAAK